MFRFTAKTVSYFGLVVIALMIIVGAVSLLAGPLKAHDNTCFPGMPQGKVDVVMPQYEKAGYIVVWSALQGDTLFYTILKSRDGWALTLTIPSGDICTIAAGEHSGWRPAPKPRLPKGKANTSAAMD